MGALPRQSKFNKTSSPYQEVLSVRSLINLMHPCDNNDHKKFLSNLMNANKCLPFVAFFYFKLKLQLTRKIFYWICNLRDILYPHVHSGKWQVFPNRSTNICKRIRLPPNRRRKTRSPTKDWWTSDSNSTWVDFFYFEIIVLSSCRFRQAPRTPDLGPMSSSFLRPYSKVFGGKAGAYPSETPFRCSTLG